jgi:hypothetical protein
MRSRARREGPNSRLFLTDVQLVSPREMRKIAPRGWVSFVKLGEDTTIYLRSGAFDWVPKRVNEFCQAVLSHEDMHLTLCELEGIETSKKFDNVKNLVP